MSSDHVLRVRIPGVTFDTNSRSVHECGIITRYLVKICASPWYTGRGQSRRSQSSISVSTIAATLQTNPTMYGSERSSQTYDPL